MIRAYLNCSATMGQILVLDEFVTDLNRVSDFTLFALFLGLACVNYLFLELVEEGI